MNKKQLRFNRPAEYVENPTPRNIMLGLTNTCNHRCVFCPHEKLKRKTAVLDPDLISRVITQAYDLGVREIGLYLDDEPFMSKHLEDSAKLAKSAGYEYIYCTTNGSLATPERVSRLYENGLDSIKFSVNAGDRDTYAKTHGHDHFDTVISNIKAADRLRKESGKNVGLFLSFVEYSQNAGQLGLLKRLLGDSIDEYHTLTASDVYFDENESAKMGMKKYVYEKCDMLFNRIHVTGEGLVSACCGDFSLKLIMGDLRERPLKDIWFGEAFRRLRRWHLEGDIPRDCECYKCFDYSKKESQNDF
jgi:MoaA/NifB/PqqE/SkfB family radical SAM enzyme